MVYSLGPKYTLAPIGGRDNCDYFSGFEGLRTIALYTRSIGVNGVGFRVYGEPQPKAHERRESSDVTM
jgi:hypothetical protein